MNIDELCKRVDLSNIYPPFAEKCKNLLQICESRGVRYYMISGYRSVTEQNELYAQGRTKPGQIVTNARGGQSAHNFGIAIDFCRDVDMQRSGLQPSWNTPDYKVLGEEAVRLGLESGLYWNFKDAPHIQLPLAKLGINLFPVANGKSGSNLPNLLEKWNAGGLKNVFSFLDSINA